MRMSGTHALWALALLAALAGCSKSSSLPAPLAPSLVAQPVAQPTTPSTGVVMQGHISDTAFRPVEGARVEVVDGPDAGLSTVTSPLGQFSLTGQFGDTTSFRASKDGYVTDSRTPYPQCGTCGSRRSIGFQLITLAAPVNIAGDYTLTFVADAACRGLPDALRTRTYDATIATSNTHTTASPGYMFTLAGSNYSGSVGVAGDVVGFWFETLTEQLTPNASVGIQGVASASVAASGPAEISMSFDGRIEYCESKSDSRDFYSCQSQYQQGVVHASCDSKSHRLILTRR